MRRITSNYARNEILNEFSRHLIPIIADSETIKVAVVGGYRNEPELEVLAASGVDFSVDFFGIDKSEREIDLNIDLNIIQTFETYDLVLCSQVLEHLFQHQNAFVHLTRLVSSTGYLWISCPASNRVHGEPDYYSAGFSLRYLVSNLRHLNFQTIAEGQVGSERLYFMVHALRTWPTPEIFAHPFRANIKYLFNGGKRKILKNLLLLILSSLTSKDTSNDNGFATESWALSKRL